MLVSWAVLGFVCVVRMCLSSCWCFFYSAGFRKQLFLNRGSACFIQDDLRVVCDIGRWMDKNCGMAGWYVCLKALRYVDLCWRWCIRSAHSKWYQNGECDYDTTDGVHHDTFLGPFWILWAKIYKRLLYGDNATQQIWLTSM